jgi:hypothetical protein
VSIIYSGPIEVAETDALCAGDSVMSDVPSHNQLKRQLLVDLMMRRYSWALTYHNHKEVMAWGSVGVFLVIVGHATQGTHDLASKIIAICVLALFGLLLGYFAHKQMELRRSSSNLISACSRLAEQFASMRDTEIEQVDMTVPPLPSTSAHGSEFTFGTYLKDEIEKIKGVPDKTLRDLERVNHGAFIVIFVAAVLIILFKP